MLLEILKKIIITTISITNDTSTWLVLSFLVAGILRNILTPEKFQNMLGNKKFSSIVKSTISGMLIPICSCGVIPLGISMYYSGSYLGPTLAFMTATPIINPVAVILTIGLLGPQIGIIYLITGIISPMVIGVIGNTFAGNELQAPGIEEVEKISLEESSEKEGIFYKLKSGMYYAFFDLGVTVSKYLIPGMLLAGIILSLTPPEFIQKYLGNPGLISLGGIAILSGVMYVCAVGHIPFIAALVATGASPGTAITFLMTGAATNIPELISIYKLIGKRAAVIYGVGVTVISFVSGYITNLILLPGFKPFVNIERAQMSINIVNKILLNIPEMVKYFCSIIVFYLFIKAFVPKVREMVYSKSA